MPVSAIQKAGNCREDTFISNKESVTEIQKTMEIDMITQRDLQIFKQEMLNEIRELIGGKTSSGVEQEWLKSADVRKMLKVSPGTLQNLRINGTLPYRKVGGSMYYRKADVNKMMDIKDHGR